MSHDDFAFETHPGLPADLPRGETILWQGRPDTRALAMQAFGLRWVLAYFLLVVLWRAGAGASAAGLPGALAWGLPYVGLALGAALLILALAWAQAKATVYTITTARVVLRVGAALSVTFNLPFRQIAGAQLDLRRDGTGTIALDIQGDTRLSYLVLWPHVRPWRFPTQPALRAIPDAARIARLLAEAAETRLSQPEVRRETGPATAVAAE
ncbi:MAG: PH domain-containing protein [Paracoccaceae bacterium]|nr:MAG: PH domain-containing protein [Paracoccaceae bacterium]